MNKNRKFLAFAVIFLQIFVVAVEDDYVPRRLEASGAEDCTELITGITVSPLVTQIPVRPMEVWWKCYNPKPGDWLGVFRWNPPNATNLGTAVASTKILERNGWWNTNFSSFDIYDAPYKLKCQNRWAAIISADNSTISGLCCLKTEFTWMEDMKDLLSPMPLTEVFFPGTHDSGANKLYNYTKADEDVYYRKHAVTQEESIIHQLNVGARYLDLRVAYYSYYSDSWWLNHGTYQMMTLKSALSDIADFIKKSKEIVLLDVHEIRQLKDGVVKNSTHDALVKFISDKLKSYLADPSLGWNATLGDVWTSGKRVILSYNDMNTVSRNKNTLWTPISQKWGKARTLEELQSFLKGVHGNVPKGPWASMAELTATITDILFERLRSIRVMADSVNKNVSEWYFGSWGETANIVAVDFIRSTNIVDAAIKWNRRKAKKFSPKGSG